jgi:hypothetical protein
MRTLALLALLLTLNPVLAQEYKPFPEARITRAEWDQYFSDVSAKHASRRRDFVDQRLITFDAPGPTSYAFTSEGHPAHPAWVTRKFVRQADGAWTVEQIGYFAGAEAPFARLYRSYQELNAQMKAAIERDHRRREPTK